MKKPKNACKQCGRCCGYFCVELDAPSSKSDIDDYAWILAHEGVAIHIESGDWHLMVRAKCKFLQGNSGCKIYNDRPRICRQHEPDACEYDSSSDHEYDDVDHVITDLDELYKLGKILFPPKKRKVKKKVVKKKIVKKKVKKVTGK